MDSQSVNPSTINQSQRFTIYLVVDGNQVQLVNVSTDIQKRVIFRNEAGQILQAISLPVTSIGNPSIFSSFETNEHYFELSNSSQINALPTNDNDTSSIHNENDVSLDEASDDSAEEEAGDHLSLSQTNNSHQRFTSLNLSNKKRQQSESYEHDQFMNKRIKSGSLIEDEKLTIPNVATAMTSFNNLNSHEHIPSSTFYDFHQHISLLTDTAEEQSRISSNDSQIISSSSRRTSTRHQSFITSTTPSAIEGEKENDFHIDPNQWTVLEVAQFIKTFTNDKIAENFVKNEIDGEALLLLTKNNLLDHMNIKLGPAIKILNNIKELRKHAETFA